jgi:hypothetical protein
MQVERRETHPPADDDRIIDDGFSSEEELQHEEICVEKVKPEQKEANHREQVRFKIPPPQEIKDKNYSLRPDIETGYLSRSF